MRRFRADPEGAQPVVLGSHRRAEAVILPYARYEQIVLGGPPSVAETRAPEAELPELPPGVTRDDLAERWLNGLVTAVDAGVGIVDRGRAAFRTDVALPLACEALIARVGELARLLTRLDPDRFHDPMWTLAAHNRQMVVHHDNRVDEQSIWMVMSEGFPEIAEVAASVRRPLQQAS
ncbi:hypothetical protein GY24_05295 [Microterricola pindariensis]|uniref:Prevent-host-death protein n=1 Tax=Microterricola pindariensis TaxID=478010 RepID=A0ABX5AXF1_9MICO|nr:hypothetical protein GY24_05295 [Microterricola pindariensis]